MILHAVSLQAIDSGPGKAVLQLENVMSATQMASTSVQQELLANRITSNPQRQRRSLATNPRGVISHHIPRGCRRLYRGRNPAG